MRIDNLFGKLTHYNTFIHRMDARLKLFGLICLMVACFLPYGISGGNTDYYCNQFLVLGVLAVIIFTLMLLSRCSIKSFFKSLSGLWFMVLFLIVLMVFIPNNTYTPEKNHILYDFKNGYVLYYDGLLSCAQIFLRIILMIALTLILTSTTSPMDLTYAFEWYLTPLRLFKIPTQIFSMILSLALRMIPTILDESHKIMKAQKSRGVEFERGFVVSKVRSITTLIVPLLISCFSKSNDMSLAMYARGYDPYKKRSKYKVLKFHLIDLISIIVLILLLAFFIFLCVISQNYGYSIFRDLFKLKGTW